MPDPAMLENVRTNLARGPGWPADPTVSPDLPPAGPLTGIRVLDLSRVLAGPFATMVLGDLGADVIKVEKPKTGDETRSWGPPFHGDDAAYFLSINRNRRSLTLNLADPVGHAVVRHLINQADVVVENFRPSQLESLNLKDVSGSDGAPIWVSVRGASGAGPDGDEPGYDAMAQARSGLMSITGHQQTGPTKVGVAIVDVVTGLYAAIAALSGLVGRAAGRGPGHVEVPLLESAVSALVNQAANVLIGEQTPGLLGNHHPNICPYGPLPTSDGQLIVGAANDRQFARLCEAADRSDLLEDPRYRSNAERVSHRDELMGALAKTFREHPTSLWQARLATAGVPTAPVQSVREALSDSQIVASGLVTEVDMTDGKVAAVGSPLRLDGERPQPRLPPPRLGAHTRQILAGLGLDADTIEALSDQGVC